MSENKRTCNACNIKKVDLAFKGKSPICRLCKAKKDMKKAKKFSLKEHRPEIDLSISDEIMIFTKNINIIYTVSYEKFLELSLKNDFKVIEQGEVYCTEYMNEFKEDFLTKEKVMDRDNYKCQYCGEVGENVDHIFPQSQGGADHPSNYLTACKLCNEAKSDIILDSIFQMKDLVKEFERRKIVAEERKIKEWRRWKEIKKRQQKYKEQKQEVKPLDWVKETEKKKTKAKKETSLDDMIASVLNGKKK